MVEVVGRKERKVAVYTIGIERNRAKLFFLIPMEECV
jgi:hypothetical protein